MNGVKRLSNLLKCELKNLKFSQKAIVVGFLLGLVFCLALDSIILGFSLGIVFMIALNEEERRKKAKEK